VFLPGAGGKSLKGGMGRLAQREPLARRPAVFSAKKMAEAIGYLSSPALEGRGSGSRGLEMAARYLAGEFKAAGLKPAGDAEGSYFQEFEADGPDGKVIQRNVIGVIPGTKAGWAGQSVVLAAHYDHLGLGWPDQRRGDEGKLHPGADDNASGVAVLLELARALAAGPPPERSIVFAAFAAEEAGRAGSRHYVANSPRYPAKKALAMVNLDTVGRLGGGKLLVIGASSAKEWMHILRGAGYVTGVPVEAVPEELDSSDQVSFEEAGVPAVQFFTGPHLDYHRPTDTAEKVDVEGLLKVGSVAREVIEYLAGRQEPLSPAGAGAVAGSAEPQRGRRVSLGTVPDFAFSGSGCRITAVVPGSPAEACGLAGGDVIVAVDGRPVTTLRDLSDILKSLSPGDRTSITFIREGEEMSAEATVEAR
jgi:aminopeptidase N